MYKAGAGTDEAPYDAMAAMKGMGPLQGRMDRMMGMMGRMSGMMREHHVEMQKAVPVADS